MTEVEKAVAWIESLPLESPRQKANGERLKQLLMSLARRLDVLARHDEGLMLEVMELRAMLDAMRAVLDPTWGVPPKRRTS